MLKCFIVKPLNIREFDLTKFPKSNLNFFREIILLNNHWIKRFYSLKLFFAYLMKHSGFTYTYFNMIDRRPRWLRNSQQDLETYGICYKKHNISWRKKTFLSIFVHVFISQKPSSSRENKNSHRFKSFPHWIKNRCWKRADNFTSQKCFSHQS